MSDYLLTCRRTRATASVDDVLCALSDPTRRALFEAALERARADDVRSSASAPRPISRWGVIKHLAVLRDAGLIQTMATGRLRRHYAEKAALDPMRDWLDRVGDV